MRKEQRDNRPWFIINICINMLLSIITVVLLEAGIKGSIVIPIPYAVFLVLSHRRKNQKSNNRFGDWSALIYFLTIGCYSKMMIWPLPGNQGKRVIALAVVLIISVGLVALLNVERRWISLCLVALVCFSISGWFWIVDDSFLPKKEREECFYVVDNTEQIGTGDLRPIKYWDTLVVVENDDGISMNLAVKPAVAEKAMIGTPYTFTIYSTALHGDYIKNAESCFLKQVIDG